MATFDQFNSNQTTRAPGLVQRIVSMVAGFGERAAQRALYRRTVDELSALSSRELADIGLNRSMIRGVARETVAAQR